MTDDAKHARAFRALSHPRRMRLFRLLCERPETRNSLQTLYATARIPEASFRHHLREMETAGLVRRQRKGAIVSIVLTPHALDMAIGTARPLLHRARVTPERAA